MNGRVIAVTVMCAVCCPAFAAEPSDPELAQMMAFLSDLAERGSFGVRNTESAAFIVKDEGDLRCLLWPNSGEFRRATHSAPVPANVVAIAHTHPVCCREASSHDRREAARLGIAVIAVSMGTLSAVDSQGKPWISRFGISWRRHADPKRRCTESFGGGPRAYSYQRSGRFGELDRHAE